MVVNHTISAILRGKWLIDKVWADAHAALILKTIKGEQVDWGLSSEKMYRDGSAEEAPAPRKVHIMTMDEGGEVYQARPYHSADKFPYNSIVMLDITGPVLKYGDVCSYGSLDHINSINKFASAKNIAGIILNIDSPGGQAAGTAMFANTIRKAIAQKPVIGIVQDGIAASAAMWILSACQEAYVTEDTDEVGSIGAYTTIMDMKGWFEQQGVKVHEIYAPQSGDKNKDYRDAVDGNYDLVQEDLKFLVDDFIGDVKAFRGSRLREGKENPFTGKMYRADEAVKIGLIDGKKSLEQVVKRMKQLISLRQKNS